MKKLLLIFTIAITNYALGQEEDVVTISNEKGGEIKTLFKDATFGGFVAPEMKVTEFDGGVGLMMGGKAAMVISHSLNIGGGGYGLVSGNQSNFLDTDGNRLHYHMGYGGLIIEPVIAYKNITHITFPILIGAGGVGLTDRYNYSTDTTDFNYVFADNDYFFVAEPGVNVEFNLFKILRLDIGASYRYINDVKLLGVQKEKDLSGFSGNISFKIGWF